MKLIITTIKTISPLRALTALSLVLNIAVAPSAGATVNGTNLEQAKQLVDEFIAMQKEGSGPDDQSKMYTSIGRPAYVAKALAIQVVSLEAEDFNLFLFYFADRYIHNPKERGPLFELIGGLRNMIKSDLEATAALRDGPASLMIQDSYYWGSLVLLFGGGALGWHKVMRSQYGRTNVFLRELQARETVAVRSNKLLRYSSAALSNRAVLWSGSLGIGAGLGAVSYLFQTKFRNHRLDPLEILAVVQSNLGCDVSHRAMELEERFNALPPAGGSAEAKAARIAKAVELKKDVDDLSAQAEDLRKQFPHLEKLSVNDRLFQEVLAVYPVSPSWQQYKTLLNQSADSLPGKCQQVSMAHVINEVLETLSAGLEGIIPPPPPPQPSTPPAQGQTQPSGALAPGQPASKSNESLLAPHEEDEGEDALTAPPAPTHQQPMTSAPSALAAPAAAAPIAAPARSTKTPSSATTPTTTPSSPPGVKPEEWLARQQEKAKQKAGKGGS